MKLTDITSITLTPGSLVDVSASAEAEYFRHPVFITAEAYAVAVMVTVEATGGDELTRLHQVLYETRLHISRPPWPGSDRPVLLTCRDPRFRMREFRDFVARFTPTDQGTAIVLMTAQEAAAADRPPEALRCCRIERCGLCGGDVVDGLHLCTEDYFA